MRSDLWPRVDRLLEQALDLPQEERLDFVDQASAGDDELKRAVRKLLAADLEVGSFLEHFTVTNATRWLEEHGVDRETEEAPPEGRFNSYRLVRRLGQGGMGSVYLAERADGQFERRVAVKVIRKDFQLPEVQIRFQAERRVLAELEHPNIAQLYDSGTSEDGRPYLVMEYVEGLPIDIYCETHDLSIEDRLHLFLPVCSAVQYAHQNLIVHRDLKPSNLLVTAEGVPKLLDFGIAKWLDLEDSEDGSQLTGTGLSPMTPHYASPEQVRGETITTSADIYSLGVMLYQLLTGYSPYSQQDALPHELARQVCEQDPMRPSDRVTDARLRRRLRGDLDRIVLMALRKEPERRYASAQQFAADIERHLANRPVLAQPASLHYVLGKFIRRNTAAVLASALLVILLFSFAIFSSVQTNRIDREREQAEQERAKAQQVSDFLLDLFDDADPDQSKGRDVTVREVLDRGAKKVEHLSDQPRLQASYRNTIGQVYRRLGLYEEATPHLDKALHLRRTLGDENPRELAQSLHEKAALLHLQGIFEEAEGFYEESVELRRQHLGPEHPELADVLVDYGLLVFYLGNPKEAEQLFREALTIQREVFGDAHEETAHTLHCLAYVLDDRGDHQAAEPLFREALDIQRGLYDGEGFDLAATLYDFAYLLLQRGEVDAAEPLYEEALGIYRKLLGPDDANVANCLNDLGLCHQRRAHYEKAEVMFRQSVAIYKKTLGEDHPHAGTAMGNLARVLIDWGDLQGAEPLCQNALAIHRSRLGDEHPLTAKSLVCLARVHLHGGELPVAEKFLEEALTIQRQALGADHPTTLLTLEQRGRLLVAKGQFEAAETLQRRMLTRLREVLGDEHPRVATCLQDLAFAVFQQGDLKGAESLVQQALERHRGLVGSEHPKIAHDLLLLAQIRLAQGQRLEGEDLARQALQLFEQRLQPDSWPITAARSVLDTVHNQLVQNSEIERLVNASS